MCQETGSGGAVLVRPIGSAAHCCKLLLVPVEHSTASEMNNRVGERDQPSRRQAIARPVAHTMLLSRQVLCCKPSLISLTCVLHSLNASDGSDRIVGGGSRRGCMAWWWDETH